MYLSKRDRAALEASGTEVPKHGATDSDKPNPERLSAHCYSRAVNLTRLVLRRASITNMATGSKEALG